MRIEDIPVLDAVRLRVEPGDILLMYPREDFLTPNQGHEVGEWLRAYIPDISVYFVPFPVDVTVLTKEDIARITEERTA